MPSQSDTSLSITSAAEQAIWAIAFDDDDIAQYLSEMAVFLLIREFYQPIEEKYSVSARSRVARLTGEVRAGLILLRDEMADRMTKYRTPGGAPEDEIPF